METRLVTWQLVSKGMLTLPFRLLGHIGILYLKRALCIWVIIWNNQLHFDIFFIFKR